ncbi:lipase (class 2) [Candidatus Regiella insecticola]|uniref:Lipase (Class 2) n=1 Tax=Candidatus Regiella insecticola TaxID=138073 RepID=A0A6L2ZQ65_9ENTR|nr:lipase (class 2) [Candidatus Regiella insecticola]
MTGANNIVIHDENLGHNALIRDEQVFSHVLNVLGCDA